MKSKAKIVIIGECRVGKTSILLKYVKGWFDQKQKSTQNACYLDKQQINSQGQKIHLSIWDTAGQEKFNSINTTYYRDADAALIVYDISNYQSFIKLQRWMNQVKLANRPDLTIFVVASKCDLKTGLQVQKQVALQYCNNEKVKHFEVSAKTGQGINALFKSLVNSIKIDKLPNISSRSKGRLRLQKYQQSRKEERKCCK